MSTFVYMTRCDGCGHCVDICPSDIMHIDENIRRAKNIEPNFCWECYSCVKACPNHAIDVRGYADFAPMGHSVRVRREEEKGTISWKIKFRNGTEKNFVSPITTKPWGKFIPKLADGEKIKQGELNSQRLYTEPEGLNINGELLGVLWGGGSEDIESSTEEIKQIQRTNEGFGIKSDYLVKLLEAEGIQGLWPGYYNLHLTPVYQKKIAYGNKGFPWSKYNNSINYKKGTCPVAEKLQDKNFLGIKAIMFDLNKNDIIKIYKAFFKVWKFLKLI